MECMCYDKLPALHTSLHSFSQANEFIKRGPTFEYFVLPKRYGRSPVTSVRSSIVRFVKLKVYHLPSQKLNSKCRIFQYLQFFVLFDGPLFYCNLCFRENKYRNSGNTIFLDQFCRYLARSINKLFTKLFILIYFTDL